MSAVLLIVVVVRLASAEEPACPDNTVAQPWIATYLAKGEANTIGLVPGMPGDHRIQFIHSAATDPEGVSEAGFAAFCWSTDENADAGDCWWGQPVTNNYNHVESWAGSEDVRFDVRLEAVDAGATFYVRLCRDESGYL